VPVGPWGAGDGAARCGLLHAVSVVSFCVRVCKSTAFILGMFLLGCGGTDAPPAVPGLGCPAEWVSLPSGGCAPAVLVCADATTTVAACVRRWPVLARSVVDGEGAGVSLHTRSRDRIGGGWSWGRDACPGGEARDEDGACAWPTVLASEALPDGRTRTPSARGCDSEPVDDGATLFVSADAPASGDGTAARPLRSLADALQQKGTATRIFVRHGTYSEAIAPRGVREIVGACAAAVTLRAPAGAAITARGAETRIRVYGIRVESDDGAVVATEGARVELSAVDLHGRGEPTVRVEEGATLSLRDAGIESGTASALRVRDGVTEIFDARITSAGSAAVDVEGDRARALLHNVVVTAAGDTGVAAGERASLTLERVIVEGALEAGVRIERARARVEHLLVRGVSGEVGSAYRSGAVVVQHGATLDARELVLADNGAYGLAVRDADTVVNVSGMVVRNVRPYGSAGACVDVNAGATATIRASVVHHCTVAGFAAAEFGRIDVRDTWIHHIASEGRGFFGFGLSAISFAGISATRTLIEDVTSGGVGAIGIPERIVERAGLAPVLRARGPLTTRIDLSDVIVRRTRPLPARPGFGIVVAAGVTFRATRVAIDGARGAGVAVTSTGYPGAALAAALGRTGAIPAGAAPVVAALLGASLDGEAAMEADDLFIRQGAPWAVGYDVGLPTTAPRTVTSLGIYVSAASRSTLRRTTILPGAEGEYGIAALGIVNASGLRIGAERRCAIGRSPTAEIATEDVALGGTARCDAEGIELVRLPVSAD